MELNAPNEEVETAPAIVPVAHSTQPVALAAAAIPVDRISELYRGEIFTEETARAARDRIHWMCAQCVGDSVLDVGCSQGITAILLAREGFSVTAIDPHPDSIAYAQGEIARETELVRQRITLLETDLASLPAQARFDSIVLGEVIEHQAIPARILRAAKAHLNEGGRLVVTTPFGLHPHPDHKVSLFPRDLVEFAAQIGMHVSGLETDGDYMRCLFLNSADPSIVLTPDVLLRTTEAATLRSEERLFSRLEDRTERLKKETDALRITKRKLAEATTALETETGTLRITKRKLAEATGALEKETDALRITKRKLAEATTALESRTLEHEAELKSLRQQKAELVALRAHTESNAADVRSKLEQSERAVIRAGTERGNAETLIRKLQDEVKAVQEQLNSARVARKHEIEALEAQLRELRAAHKHQLGQLNARNERLKDRIGALTENARATKATTSYRLGRLLVHSCKSPGALLRLPSGLWALGRDVKARRRTRKLLENADVDNPLPRVTSKDSPPRSAKTTESRGRGSPVAQPAAPREEVSVEALRAIYDEGGVDAVRQRLVQARAGIPTRLLASRALHLGKQLSESLGSGVNFTLAQLALELDNSEQTLRGYFWAAQKAREFAAASDAIAALARCYGDTPTEEQQAVLEKLRISPAHQLSTLRLVVERAENPIVGIRGRVCYVLHNSLPYSSGGYATRSQGVAGGLRDAGREVIVLTRPGFPLDITTEATEMGVPAEDVIEGVTYVRTLDPKRRGLSMVRYVTAAADAIEQQLRRLRPEIVMAASNHVTALPALIAARRVGLPFIYEIRGLWEITRSSREEEFQDTPAFVVQSMLEGKVAQLADHVFTLTEPMREELVSRGVPAERIELLPNSCDPDRFRPRPRDHALAQRLSIPPDVPVIGYIGTFVDYEGLEDLALACALLKNRGVTFRLMLVGNENASGSERGPITERILRIAAAENMGDWLVMPGRVPHEEVEAYYSLIDIAPFPRKPWQVCEMVSPMKPLEALAMEKAVLVSSVRALVEMIKDGETGRVFEKGNIASMADGLAQLIANPEGRRALGQRGRAWVRAERTWSKTGAVAVARFDQLTLHGNVAGRRAA